VQVEIRRMNNDFHQFQNYQKINEYQFINSMFFGAKKKETTKIDDTSSKDLELVTKMNQEFAKSLDLKETLNNSLELIKMNLRSMLKLLTMIQARK
jgi:sigma-B regulation protein RsbU (phosphoserine phosphatase)